MIDVVELLVHWHAGRRIGEVCSSLGVDSKTVRKYVAPAVAAGLVPGGPPLSAGQWTELVTGWFPELVERARRQRSWPEIEQHRERIKGWIGVVTVSTIHQRLRDDRGLGVSESSLRRFIWANFDEEVAREPTRGTSRLFPEGNLQGSVRGISGWELSRGHPSRPVDVVGGAVHGGGKRHQLLLRLLRGSGQLRLRLVRRRRPGFCGRAA